MKELKKLFPLDLQLFAEDGGNDGGNGSETPKKYTQEEFDKLVAERDKYKKANDNLSKENADYKRKAKDKLTEDERIAEEQKAKEEELANTRKELLTIKMSKELMSSGFDEKAINEILEKFNGEDSVEFARTLSKHINNLVENVRKEEKTKFQQSSTTPPTGNGAITSGLDPIVERYINNKNKNSNKARDMLFGNNK